jgi:hypothetical protein
MGQMEMKCIFNIGKNISILAKVTQVAHDAKFPSFFGGDSSITKQNK